MSGETFQEQMARVRRKLREVGETPPNHRPDYMPRTKAQRLAELEAIKADHGLKPGQSVRALFLTSRPSAIDEPGPGPVPVWEIDLPDGRRLRVMARARPPGARGLSQEKLTSGDPGAAGEPSF